MQITTGPRIVFPARMRYVRKARALGLAIPFGAPTPDVYDHGGVASHGAGSW
jgi:hypothetical protein